MNKYIAFTLGFAFAYAFGAVALRAYAEEIDRMYPELEQQQPRIEWSVKPSKSGQEIRIISQKTEVFGPWRKTHATFYGAYYDTGPGRFNRTSDLTPYRPDGMFCATYLVPLGTTIEVKRGKVILRLVVRDRPARVNGHKIDIPTKTWDRFGAKRSIGKLPVEWRVVR